MLIAALFSSVQSLSCDSLKPYESQHARPPCPSPTPGVYSNSCPSSRWWHPAISSSVVPFSSCPQSLPASGSFPMSQLFTCGGQSIGISASASVLPMNTQDWSPLDLLAVQGTLKSLLQHHSLKASNFRCSALKRKQIKYLLTNKCMNKILYIQKMKYYSILKRKEILQYVTSWMKLKDIMLGEISQS